MIQIQEVKVWILFTSTRSLRNNSKHHCWKKDLAVCRHKIIIFRIFDWSSGNFESCL